MDEKVYFELEASPCQSKFSVNYIMVYPAGIVYFVPFSMNSVWLEDPSRSSSWKFRSPGTNAIFGSPRVFLKLVSMHQVIPQRTRHAGKGSDTTGGVSPRRKYQILSRKIYPSYRWRFNHFYAQTCLWCQQRRQGGTGWAGGQDIPQPNHANISFVMPFGSLFGELAQHYPLPKSYAVRLEYGVLFSRLGSLLLLSRRQAVNIMRPQSSLKSLVPPVRHTQKNHPWQMEVRWSGPAPRHPLAHPCQCFSYAGLVGGNWYLFPAD